MTSTPKKWWETWWANTLILIVTGVIAGLIIWGITRHYDKPSALRSVEAPKEQATPPKSNSDEPSADHSSPIARKPDRATKPAKAAQTSKRPTVATPDTNSSAIGSVTQGPGSALSINQQGGITAGTIINPPSNPNRRNLVYACNGSWQSTGPGPNTVMEVATCLPDKCEKMKVFNDMMELNNARKYPELLDRCQQEIKTTPEWLTSYLFCGLADVGIGDSVALKTTLAYYEHTGPSYATGQCPEISEFFHGKLKP